MQSYRELPTTVKKTILCKPLSRCTKSSEKVIPFSSLYNYYEKMSDLSSDSENDYLSEEVDITCSSESTDSSSSSDRTADSAEQARGNPDNLSSISNILTPRSGAALTWHAQEGDQRLRQILKLDQTTLPNCSFPDELNGVWASEQPRTQTDP
ncbi:hypothetical protein TIFTF001_008382 [Ficus carica]|uniref:Uncharacterized protein n=1 Tax=Ficus carica TaxID=3494 RepID=A0AA87ZS39_FICCA|nr:hypothetical protein TIFTF001_008382 [Ficus carica]